MTIFWTNKELRKERSRPFLSVERPCLTDIAHEINFARIKFAFEFGSNENYCPHFISVLDYLISQCLLNPPPSPPGIIVFSKSRAPDWGQQ